MLHLTNLYQTVADKENPDFVENEGPFICRYKPWLGVGYYFWDNLLERAHWWGRTHYSNNYMICKAYVDIESDKCLDLAGNMEQLDYFNKCYKAIKKNYDAEVITVCFVINKLIRDGNFPFEAVRALSENCGGDESKMPFVEGHRSFLNLTPPMQICVFVKSRVRDYHVIYPEEYAINGVV
mgnify:CR=1 FL=1